jgi:hypothetical protein
MGLAKNGGTAATSAAFDYAGLLVTVDQIMQEFGMVASLQMLNGGAVRPCWACITKFNPMDMATQLANPTERQILIDPLYADAPIAQPDWQYERLVTYNQPAPKWPTGVVNENLSFKEPIELVSPAGITVLYICTVKK